MTAESTSPTTTENLLPSGFEQTSPEIKQILETILRIQEFVDKFAREVYTDNLNRPTAEPPLLRNARANSDIGQANDAKTFKLDDRTQTIIIDEEKPAIELDTHINKGGRWPRKGSHNTESLRVTPTHYEISRLAQTKAWRDSNQRRLSASTLQIPHEETAQLGKSAYHIGWKKTDDDKMSFDEIRKVGIITTNDNQRIEVRHPDGQDVQEVLTEFHRKLVEACKGRFIDLPEELERLDLAS
ncbi:hypothetical protein HN709_00190 [Candidatus Peregrinibacteria bacterium]|jgi:hypothetical protein|nr:hypothetical protein [Candidatus Peregrinibacteria bacterium]MBT7736091.1 hypothetical protein [Candidatus Peregrinibacteria bacterium]